MVDQGLGWRGSLGVLPILLWYWVWGRGALGFCHTFGLGPSSSEMAVGSFCLFCIFWSWIFPNCTWAQLLLVPYSFFVFCSSRRGVSRCELCPIATKVPWSQAGGRAVPRISSQWLKALGEDEVWEYATPPEGFTSLAWPHSGYQGLPPTSGA